MTNHEAVLRSSGFRKRFRILDDKTGVHSDRLSFRKNSGDIALIGNRCEPRTSVRVDRSPLAAVLASRTP